MTVTVSYATTGGRKEPCQAIASVTLFFKNPRLEDTYRFISGAGIGATYGEAEAKALRNLTAIIRILQHDPHHNDAPPEKEIVIL